MVKDFPFKSTREEKRRKKNKSQRMDLPHLDLWALGQLTWPKKIGRAAYRELPRQNGWVKNRYPDSREQELRPFADQLICPQFQLHNMDQMGLSLFEATLYGGEQKATPPNIPHFDTPASQPPIFKCASLRSIQPPRQSERGKDTTPWPLGRALGRILSNGSDRILPPKSHPK